MQAESQSDGRVEVLRIDLKPSVRLAAALGIIHLVAVVCVWVSLSDWPWVLVTIGVLLSGLATLSESMMWRGAAAVSIELRPDGRSSWKDRNGKWHEAQLGGDHFVSVPLVILALREGALRRKWILLVGDSARPDELRRLRARLRLEPTGASRRA